MNASRLASLWLSIAALSATTACGRSNEERCRDLCAWFEDCVAEVDCTEEDIDDCVHDVEEAGGDCEDALDDFLDCTEDNDGCQDTARACGDEGERVEDRCSIE